MKTITIDMLITEFAHLTHLRCTRSSVKQVIINGIYIQPPGILVLRDAVIKVDYPYWLLFRGGYYYTCVFRSR